MHSLTHFYNWSFSHVRTTYSMKWDGDMVLTREGVGYLADLSWQLEDSDAVVAIPRHPLSIDSESEAWIDLGYRFLEPWVYPMGPEFTFVKAFEWEVREFPDTSERIVAPEGLCVELKWLDAGRVRALEQRRRLRPRSRAPRKAREWDVYPRSPRAAATRCPAWSGSRRRPACTSSTTSPTPGCRAPSGRSCGGCRRGPPRCLTVPEPVRAFLDPMPCLEVRRRPASSAGSCSRSCTGTAAARPD